MRIVVAGAGAVGRSIARELLGNGHSVLLIDRDASEQRVAKVPGAAWLLGDACELSVLTEAGLERCDAVVAATGDDKANLVLSLLARTEFGVPRTVARVNHPRNEWMFNDSWGVDVAVSTPRLMTALVEEAMSQGDLVRIFEFPSANATMSEITVPDGNRWVGEPVRALGLPAGSVLVGVLRDESPLAPEPDMALEVGDQLLFLTSPAGEQQLAAVFGVHAAAHEIFSEDID